MTQVQKVYRVIRPFCSREDTRYAAPRLVQLWGTWAETRRVSG